MPSGRAGCGGELTIGGQKVQRASADGWMPAGTSARQCPFWVCRQTGACPLAAVGNPGIPPCDGRDGTNL